jgi:hypothetical protein
MPVFEFEYWDSLDNKYRIVELEAKSESEAHKKFRAMHPHKKYRLFEPLDDY